MREKDTLVPAVALIILSGLLFYFRFLTGIVTNTDFWSHTALSKLLTDSILGSGNFFPAWTQGFGCGESFLRFQGGLVYYPMSVIQIVLRTAGINEGRAVLLSSRAIVLICAVGMGVTMFFFVRSRLGAILPALLSAIAYQASWVNIAEAHSAGSLSRLSAHALAPLVACLVWSGRVWSIKTLLAGALCGIMLVEHSASAIIFLGALVFYHLLMVVLSKERRVEVVNRGLGPFVASVALGFAFAGYFIIPLFIEVGYFSDRFSWEGAVPWLKLTNFANLAKFLSRSAVMSGEPSALAYQVISPYLGVVALPLALISGLLPKKREELCLLGVLLLLLLVVGRVVWHPLEPLRAEAFGSMRFIYTANFLVCLLAGYGSKLIAQRWWVFVALIVLVVADFFSLNLKKFPTRTPPPPVEHPWATAGSNGNWPLLFAWEFYRRQEGHFNVIDFPPAQANYIGPAVHSKGNARPWDPHSIHPAFRELYFDLEAEIARNLYQGGMVSRGFISRVALLNIRYISVRFVLATGQMNPEASRVFLSKSREWVNLCASTPSGDRLVFETKQHWAYLIPRKVVRIAGQKNWKLFNKTIFSRDDFDPRLTSFVYTRKEVPSDGVLLESPSEELLKSYFGAELGKTEDRAEILKWDGEVVEMSVDLGSDDRWIFLPLQYYPNWRCWIDGKPGSLYMAQAGLTAILVPRGAHMVRLAYVRQWYDWVGRFLSLSLLCLTVFAITASYRKRSGSRQ